MRYISSDIQVKLEAAVLTACRQSLPLDNLEVDAIICVNVADRREEHVVKIHQRFDRCGGLPNRNFMKVNVVPHNDYRNIVIDKVELGKNTDVKTLENGTVDILNVPFVPASQGNLTSQKESNDNVEVSNKVVINSGRSSKQKRKSSTPRCLNPKFRLKNVDNVLGLVTENDGNITDDASESISNNANNNLKLNYIDNETLNEMKIKWEENLETESVNCLSKEEIPSAKHDGNKYIKIEPKADVEFTGIKEVTPDNENMVAEEKYSNIGSDSVDEHDHSADNDFTIEVNSDSESYDTTYNYTFDKTVDESLEENTRVNTKSFDDSDDQSLGSSPTDLTNSMMSYNVSHIMPAGTLGENSDILDVPNYRSRNFGNCRQIAPKAGGKWNDLKSKKRTDVPTSVEKLSCRTCGAIFSSTRTRRRHETSTCGATRFSCVVCSKLFSRKDARRRHMMRMHPIYWTQTSQAVRSSERIQA